MTLEWKWPEICSQCVITVVIYNYNTNTLLGKIRQLPIGPMRVMRHIGVP